MNTKYYIILVIVVIVAVIMYLVLVRPVPSATADEQESVKCGTKTVFRYKQPSKIFPVIISDYSSSFKVASGILDKLITDTSGGNSVSANVKDSAIQLRENLDQDNIFFENNLKAYFLALNDDPCNDSLRYMYTGYITAMSDKVIQLKQFVAQVSSPVSTATSTGSNVTDSVLAVVDTSKKQVTAGIDSINPNNNNQLIVVKNNRNLNLALSNLKTGYKVSDKKEMRVVLPH